MQVINLRFDRSRPRVNELWAGNPRLPDGKLQKVTQKDNERKHRCWKTFLGGKTMKHDNMGEIRCATGSSKEETQEGSRV